MIYLDHNAITPVRPEARAAVAAALDAFGNPSSVHAAGRAARDLLDRAREQAAAALGARPPELVFTSGATEAAAIAIRGALALAPAGRRRLVVTAVEHPCVLGLGRALERAGTPLTVVPVDRRGRVDPDAFRAALGPDVALACAMRANNETGVLLDVPALAAAARGAGVPLLCDAVQAAGKIPLDVRQLGADLAFVTGQKLGGPRGAGALWIAPGLVLAPLFGGEQERGRRAGTENLPGIAGLGAAIEAAVRARPEEEPRIAALRDRLERGLLETVPGVRVNGAGAPRLPGTSSLTFQGCDAEALLMALDLDGLCASAGSACHSGSTTPSGVLLAIGLSEAEARSTVRFSLGWTTTADEIEAALRLVPPLVARVRTAIAPAETAGR
ncbi:MAG TPA: cysteine desulfurase family protein [Anaeromyxobacter sp.]|nr:cysteine desulfurase family protein [Anaeromyxobacter sp.]